MRAILLLNGNLLVPVDLNELGDGFDLREIGPDHPEFGRWLAVAE